MSKFALFLIIIISANLSLFPSNIKDVISGSRAEFNLTIENIPKVEGEIRIAIFDSEEAYNSKENPVYAIVLPVESKTISWSETGLPYGNYAIAVYHDKNENGELDTNFLGIPKEAYGFSNDARGKFGPASWKDAKFEVNAENVSHTIHIK